MRHPTSSLSGRQRVRRMVSLVLLACVSVSSSAHGWVWGLPQPGQSCSETMSAVVDARGDLVLAGYTGIDYEGYGSCDRDSATALIVKLDGVAGELLWRVDGDPAGCVTAQVVGIRADGDVVVQLQARECGDWWPTGTEVLRLAAESGAIRWRRSFAGDLRTLESPGTVDAAGDVIVTDGGTPVKLAGDDGRELWRADESMLGGYRHGRRLLAGPGGQTILIQSREWLLDAATNQWTGGAEVIALADLDGQVRWRRHLPGDDVSAGLDTDGNVALALPWYTLPMSGPSWRVLELHAADGSVAWDASTDGASALAPGEPRGLAVAAGGTVVVVGDVVGEKTDADFAAMAFDGATGARRWQQVHDGGARLRDYADGVVLDRDGDLIVTGHERRRERDQRGFVSTTRKLRLVDGTLRWLRTGTSQFTLPGPHHVFGVGGTYVTTLSSESGGEIPCGDGVLDAGEECDDANGLDDDGCDVLCRRVVCGDGVVGLAEECDDGNTAAGDGCDPSCAAERACGASDLRGRWLLELGCSGFFWSFGAVAWVDVEQDCATGALTATATRPERCAWLNLQSKSVDFDCAVAPTLTSGATDGTGVRFPATGAIESRLDVETAIGLPSCAATSFEARYAFDGLVYESAPGQADYVSGPMWNAITIREADGTVCEPDPSQFECGFSMKRRSSSLPDDDEDPRPSEPPDDDDDPPTPPDDGDLPVDEPVDRPPSIECRDGDPCTIDVGSADGCEHVALRGGAALACRRQTGWAGTSCESGGHPKRLARVLERLESPRTGRRLLRLWRLAGRLGVRAARQGRLPGACHAELSELLSGLRDAAH